MGKEVRNTMSKVISLTVFLIMVISTSVSAKTVNLAWDPSPDTNVAGYKVYYDAGSSSLPLNGTGANEGTSPVDIGSALTASINGLSDTQIHRFTITAYDTYGNESSYSNIVTSPPVVSIPNPVLWDSTQASYMTIQYVYDSIPSGQTDTIMVKAGEQAPENLYFDRDVTIRLIGGYDHIFTNIIGDTSFYGTLTITGGPVTVSDLIIK
jgi:hypothetical protein